MRRVMMTRIISLCLCQFLFYHAIVSSSVEQGNDRMRIKNRKSTSTGKTITPSMLPKRRVRTLLYSEPPKTRIITPGTLPRTSSTKTSKTPRTLEIPSTLNIPKILNTPEPTNLSQINEQIWSLQQELEGLLYEQEVYRHNEQVAYLHDGQESWTILYSTELISMSLPLHTLWTSIFVGVGEKSKSVAAKHVMDLAKCADQAAKKATADNSKMILQFAYRSLSKITSLYTARIPDEILTGLTKVLLLDKPIKGAPYPLPLMTKAAVTLETMESYAKQQVWCYIAHNGISVDTYIARINAIKVRAFSKNLLCNQSSKMQNLLLSEKAAEMTAEEVMNIHLCLSGGSSYTKRWGPAPVADVLLSMATLRVVIPKDIMQSVWNSLTATNIYFK